MLNVTWRTARQADAERCFEIERTAYEGDEAATLEKIALRIAGYPQGFLVMEYEGNVIGFINSGCAWDVVMSDEAFKELVGHDADAPKVVIMSVVIDPAWQGKKLAGPMMATFVDQMCKLGKTEIHLMCKARHVPLYEKMGYRYMRPSASEHGGMAWHEMMMPIEAK